MEPPLFKYPIGEKVPNFHHQGNEGMIFVIGGAIEFKYGAKIIL